jgi:hypothetical protein
VWYYSDNITALFISVEECKSTWARLRSYYRKALRRREVFCTDMYFYKQVPASHPAPPFPCFLLHFLNPKCQCACTRLRTSRYRAAARKTWICIY